MRPSLSSAITVLLVNGNGDNWDMLAAKFFERIGCRVIHARNIDQALIQIDRQQIDVVITDYVLRASDETGVDLLKIICAQSGSPPLMMLITNGSESKPRENLSGIATVFRKPVSAERLIQFALSAVSGLATAEAV